MSERAEHRAAAPRWIERMPLLWALSGLALCSAVLAAGARQLHGRRLSAAEALFIVLPATLALAALVPAARSTVGRALKAVLLGLCVLAPLCADEAVWLGAGAPLGLGAAALGALLLRPRG